MWVAAGWTKRALVVRDTHAILRRDTVGVAVLRNGDQDISRALFLYEITRVQLFSARSRGAYDAPQ